MTTQLELIEAPEAQKPEAHEVSWKLSPETIELGFKGIAEARKVLRKSAIDLAA